MKRAVAITVVLCCIVLSCSCGKKTPDKTEDTTKEYNIPTPVIKAEVSLPYIGMDSLDPFTAQSTLNRDALTAVFEGLFEPTSDGKGNPVIASFGEIDGKTVTVKLKQDLLFSDGTPLTSAHILSSFEKARSSAVYSKELSGFSGAAASDNYTVSFTLKRNNEFALNALCFPVVSGKAGSYVGTGAYKISSVDGSFYLEGNKYNSSFGAKALKQIALYDMAGASSAVYPFKANDISVYKNDLSGGEYSLLSPKTVSVPTNNFVFAGINMTKSSSLLSIGLIRNAINVGINREQIAASSFLGQCSATVTPFKSEIYVNDELVSVSGNAQRAVNLLEESGFDGETASGVRTNGVTTLSVTILVCSDNQYKTATANALKTSLEALGFSVNVSSQKKEDYLESLKKGYYDIYIGETALTCDFDLSEFFTKDGALSYGIDSAFFAEYTSYRDGTKTLSQFIESFYTSVPFVPLFYRNAVLSYNPSLEGVEGSFNVYKNAANWRFKSEN